MAKGIKNDSIYSDDFVRGDDDLVRGDDDLVRDNDDNLDLNSPESYLAGLVLSGDVEQFNQAVISIKQELSEIDEDNIKLLAHMITNAKNVAISNEATDFMSGLNELGAKLDNLFVDPYADFTSDEEPAEEVPEEQLEDSKTEHYNASADKLPVLFEGERVNADVLKMLIKNEPLYVVQNTFRKYLDKSFTEDEIKQAINLAMQREDSHERLAIIKIVLNAISNNVRGNLPHKAMGYSFKKALDQGAVAEAKLMFDACLPSEKAFLVSTDLAIKIAGASDFITIEHFFKYLVADNFEAYTKSTININNNLKVNCALAAVLHNDNLDLSEKLKVAKKIIKSKEHNKRDVAFMVRSAIDSKSELAQDDHIIINYMLSTVENPIENFNFSVSSKVEILEDRFNDEMVDLYEKKNFFSLIKYVVSDCRLLSSTQKFSMVFDKVLHSLGLKKVKRSNRNWNADYIYSSHVKTKDDTLLNPPNVRTTDYSNDPGFEADRNLVANQLAANRSRPKQ